MKRSGKKFSTLCLVTAAALSLMLGIGLPGIQAFSAAMVSRLFPVAYQITYRSTGAPPVTAPVRFATDTAIVITPSGDTAVPLSDAVFVCLQDELRIQNVLRSGLLTALIVSAAVCLPAALVATAFSNKTHKTLSSSKRRAHTAPRYTAGGARRIPTMPNAA